MIISKAQFRFFTNMTINCRGQLLDLSIPKVMGILNVTPDSFYDGGKYTSEASVLQHAEKMLSEGADILDIGGMSSRPGAKIISSEEELQRVIPHLKSLIQQFPDAIISVDTIHAKVADESLQAGAHMINDISAGRFDGEMLSVVAKHNAPFIIMHMKGLPADMQREPQYANITLEVMDFFAQRIEACRAAGINDVMLDPGFGFGKTLSHNYTLLCNLPYFQQLNLPMVAGMSRKGMIYQLLGIKPGDALNGTTVANTIALMKGTHILRVHDVKEAKEAVRVVQSLLLQKK
jgi:dihydropteroate synthase